MITEFVKFNDIKDEGSNWKKENFRMSDVPNLNINECSNVERVNLWESIK